MSEALVSPAAGRSSVGTRVTCVIVSWNVRGHLLKCLKSVLASADRSGIDLETVVVDNASNDGTVGAVSERFPSVEVIANDQNVGLAKAVSQVAGLSQSEYLFLLNPDTWLEDGALGRLVGALDEYPAVGVVGPAIVAGDGRAEQPCRRFPRWHDFFLESTLLERLWPASPSVRHYRCVDLPAQEVQHPDWITGAALMLRRSAIGGEAVFDTRFFMYSEELDLCRRLRSNGWKVLYEPAAVVHHAGGRSASQDDYLRNVRFHDSKAAYMAEHHGRSLELVFRLFIALSLTVSGLEDWIKGNLVEREDWRIRRAAMYTRSGLWHLRRLISRMDGK